MTTAEAELTTVDWLRANGTVDVNVPGKSVFRHVSRTEVPGWAEPTARGAENRTVMAVAPVTTSDSTNGNSGKGGHDTANSGKGGYDASSMANGDSAGNSAIDSVNGNSGKGGCNAPRKEGSKRRQRGKRGGQQHRSGACRASACDSNITSAEALKEFESSFYYDSRTFARLHANGTAFKFWNKDGCTLARLHTDGGIHSVDVNMPGMPLMSWISRDTPMGATLAKAIQDAEVYRQGGRANSQGGRKPSQAG